MPLEATYLNERIELLGGPFGDDRAAQIQALTRLYNRLLGPIYSVNYLRPELLDLSIYSAYCHHVPIGSLIRDLRVKAAPTHSPLSGGGKGPSPLRAVLGALGEMAERLLGTLHYMAIFDHVEYATCAELMHSGRRVLGPEDLSLFAPEQYAQPGFEYVQFRSDSFLGWVEGRDLLTDEPIMVPAQPVLMYYRRHAREKAIAYATTAGGAFHISREQSILHGLYEVIERDALNVRWYSRLPPPRVAVDLDDVLRTYFDVAEPRATTPYIPEVQVFLTNLDLQVPVLTAIAVDNSRQERAFLGGSGAAGQREHALAQALFEVGQCQTGFRCDDPFGRNPIYEDSDMSEIVDFFDAPLYFGYARNLPRTFWYTASEQVVPWHTIPSRNFACQSDEYAATIDWLRGTRLRPIIFDFDAAAWPGVSITKVFVPQLTQACPPQNPMLGHPRFYELPMQLGWCDRILDFNDLNSDPIPFA